MMFTLQFTLIKPASYFLTITSLWLFHPVPPELVEELGDAWQTTEALCDQRAIYARSPLNPETQTILHRNSLWPLPRPGNVDIVNILYFDEAMPAYQLWQAKSLDVSPLPIAERETILNQSPQKAQFTTEPNRILSGL